MGMKVTLDCRYGPIVGRNLNGHQSVWRFRKNLRGSVDARTMPIPSTCIVVRCKRLLDWALSRIRNLLPLRAFDYQKFIRWPNGGAFVLVHKLQHLRFGTRNGRWDVQVSLLILDTPQH
jgi:hypothetical protein